MWAHASVASRHSSRVLANYRMNQARLPGGLSSEPRPCSLYGVTGRKQARMVEADPTPRSPLDVLVAEVRMRLRTSGRPFLVAVDGRSGAGKSTIAGQAAAILDAALVPTDDFFAATLTDRAWSERSPPRRVADALDWRRLRAEALEPLLAGRPAHWRAFDFEAGARPDGSYAFRTLLTECRPRPVVILEGAYSSRPELTDLIALAVLIETPAPLRRARLAAREAPEHLAVWHARWDAAEDYYFTKVRTRNAFPLVLEGVTSPASS